MPQLQKATAWLRLAFASGMVGGASAPAKSFDIRTADLTAPSIGSGVIPTVDPTNGMTDAAAASTAPQPLDLSWQTTVVSAPLPITGTVGLGGLNVAPDDAPTPHVFVGLKHEQRQAITVAGAPGHAYLSLQAGATLTMDDMADLQAVQHRIEASNLTASYRMEWQPEHLRRDALNNTVEFYARGDGFNTDAPSATVGVRGVMPFGE